MKILSFDTARWSKGKRPGRHVTPLERAPDDAVKPPLRPFSPLPPRTGDENVVPFKRRDPLRRRRRNVLLRWSKPMALALLIVGSPVAVVVWVLTSGHFALDEIRVSTGDQVSQRWVEAALEPYRGQNLLRLPLAPLQQRLSDGHPWIEAVSLRKDLPRRLELSIVEKQAVAVLHQENMLFYLDAEGAVIESLDATLTSHDGGAADLVMITLPESAAISLTSASGVASAGSFAAISLLREIEAASPAWLAGLSEIRVLGGEDFEVFSTDLPFSLLVRAGTVDSQSRRFEELQAKVVERFGMPRAVDLRFARRIIVQPYNRSVQANRGSTSERKS